MAEPDDLPEPDRLEGAPHPRMNARLYGQQAAEAGFLEAVAADRLHHAWLLTGPQGVGKATLAWRIARFLIATPETGEEALFGAPAAPETLDVAPDHPVARRMAALSEPRLFLLRRAWDDDRKRLKAVITVDEARKLKGFFSLSSTDGGRRVVIVDAADEMNPSAANAVLKLLEEPPPRTVLLLISHQPAGLLPTIRSRCRTLRCQPLEASDLSAALAACGTDLPEDAAALSALAGGSVGDAHLLMREGGLEFYAALVALIARAPGIDRPAALALCDRFGGRREGLGIDRALHLVDLLLARLARTGIAGPPTPEAAPGEGATMRRLCPDARASRVWAALQQAQGARARHGVAVNLDPATLLLDTVLKIDAEAARIAPAPT